MSTNRPTSSATFSQGSGKSLNSMRPFTFPDLLDAFRRRCVKTLAMAVPAALLVGALIWETLPPSYVATALLQVHQFEQVMLGNAEERSAEFITYRDSQINYMRSRPVLLEALRMEGVRSCKTLNGNPFPVEYLEETLKVEADISPEFLRLTLKGRHAEDVALIVNAVKDAYLNKVVYNERHHRVRILRQLEKEYTELDRKVKLNEQRIDQLAHDLGTGDAKVAAVIQSQLQEQIRDLQQDLQDINMEIRAEMTAREFLSERGLPADQALTLPGFPGIGDDGTQQNTNDPRMQLAAIQRQIRQFESQFATKTIRT